MRLTGHMSLTRDLNAPKALTDTQNVEIGDHPYLQGAITARDQSLISDKKVHTATKWDTGPSPVRLTTSYHIDPPHK
jgi:hypothetical protein